MLYLLRNNRAGFTLIELVVVIVIIGALVSFGVPAYQRARERAIDADARTGLKLIQAAEERYRAANGVYYPPGSITVTDVATINSILLLNLNENEWDYSIEGGGNTYWAIANRRVPASNRFGRSYDISPGVAEASCTPWGAAYTCP